jgi:hypothetical protein
MRIAHTRIEHTGAGAREQQGSGDNRYEDARGERAPRWAITVVPRLSRPGNGALCRMSIHA